MKHHTRGGSKESAMFPSTFVSWGKLMFDDRSVISLGFSTVWVKNESIWLFFGRARSFEGPGFRTLKLDDQQREHPGRGFWAGRIGHGHGLLPRFENGKNSRWVPTLSRYATAPFATTNSVRPMSSFAPGLQS